MNLLKLLVPMLISLLCLVGGHTAANAADRERTYTHTLREKQASVERLRSRARSGERVRVIVGLAEGYVPLGGLDSTKKAKGRERISRSQGRLVSSLPRGRFAEHRRFRNMPFMAIEIDADQLDALSALPEVTSIEADELSRPSLSSSGAVIGSARAWGIGYDGAGQAIVVLDTGVDAAHPYFATAGKVIAEACFSTNSPAEGGVSLCPGGAESSTEAGSGASCFAAGCDHGTHVAGIAAGNDYSGANYGVARGAEVIAVQVYTEFANPGLCGVSSPCALSYASDQVAALEYIFSIRNDYNIAVVNLSLGAGAYTGDCDDVEVARKAAIDNLRAAGVPTIVASGNGGSSNEMQAPACISSAIGVGATTDSDEVASFSNVSRVIDLLAPGAAITSAVPGGGVSTKSGTSMAAAQVSGAWAVLKQRSPDASPDQILDILYSTGAALDDNRASGEVLGLRRIDLASALELEPPQALAPDSLFVPMTGCRLVDTRVSGEPIESMKEYDFLVGKGRQGLGGQGGSSLGCGIPQDASAIQVTFTVLSLGSEGYLRAWPAQQTEPEATVLAWSGGAVANSMVLALCGPAPCSADFTTKLYGDWEMVNLVIDVQGYYQGN